MAVFSEDVIIRMLVDADRGIKDANKLNRELKETGKTAGISSKSVLKFAASVASVSAVIDLAVKAGAKLFQYLKESEAEFVESIKTNENYTEGINSAVKAIDDLAAAKEHLSVVNGRFIAEALEEHRARRAINIERKAAFKDIATEEELMTAAALGTSGATVAVNDYKDSIIAASAAVKIHTTTIDEQVIALDALMQRSRALDEFYAITVGTTTKDITELMRGLAAQFGLLTEEELINYNASKQIAALDALMASQSEENIMLLAAEGLTYAALTEKIYAQRDALLEVAEVVATLPGLLANTGSMFEKTFGPDVTAERIAGFNALGGAINGFLKSAFGDSKQAASVMALINTALAITNVLANIIPPFNFVAAALVAAAGAAQIAAINGAHFADGTPPGGYTVPQGFDGDNFPVYAKSGEVVSVSNGSDSGGGDITIMLDSMVLAKTMTNLIRNRQIVIRQSDLVA